MRAHRRTLRFALAAPFLALLAFAAPARAGETIDAGAGQTVRNNMHSCPPGAIVTGIHVNLNQLLCLSNFADNSGFLTRNETVVSGAASQWPPDATTRTAHGYTGPAIPWCGPDRYVTGVHVANRTFNCSQFPGGFNRNYTQRLGHLVVDPGTAPTVRQSMHACPSGSVLVGANFDNNTFLCAELPFCQETSHCPGSGAGEVCEFQSTYCDPDEDCLFPTTGVCRRRGTLALWEGNNCQEDPNGFLTDRSGNFVNLDTDDSFWDDDTSSVRLSGAKAGTIFRIYDDSLGSTGDDWTQVLVKNTTSQCLGSFESSFENGTLKVQHNHFDGLDGEVSRVEVRSAIIDSVGRRCVDVNQNNNTAQLFDCHAGPNQSWTYEVDGRIRGLNNLCLEADSSQIHTWLNLPAGQVRRAAVRIANCTTSVHQKWTVTEAGQIRMFADMCLDIQGGTSQNNAVVQLYPCHGGANQRWLSSF